MKYVRPCSLFNVMIKKAKEMEKREAVGEFSCLFGLNILEDFISIGISLNGRRVAASYGTIKIKDQNIYNIAHDLRCHCFAENVAGIVVGLPGTLKNENPDGAKVKSFVDRLCNTGKLEGLDLNYTYLEERFASKLMEKRLEFWPPGKEWILELNSGVGILEGYLDLYGDADAGAGAGDGDGDGDGDACIPVGSLPLPLDSLCYLPPLLTAKDHQLT
ncbi:hypothetical protein Dsin_018986 [Dipteronia sinensis]|uniref:Uncharacterized protein n=1 Tax=Dipteronia sinensis TaxID=43782 RepID=A0AAE0E2B3_9ROSI|nr:hypothetical protein Dsin_018986 [Dipteronia sinensis]